MEILAAVHQGASSDWGGGGWGQVRQVEFLKAVLGAHFATVKMLPWRSIAIPFGAFNCPSSLTKSRWREFSTARYRVRPQTFRWAQHAIPLVNQIVPSIACLLKKVRYTSGEELG